jgi:hypothetical protein
MTDYRKEWLRKYRRIDDDKAFDTLIAIGDLVVENTDGDGDWTNDIEGYVWDALEALGVLSKCDECNGGMMVSGGDCPRDHPCTNCGYFDCECCGDCDNNPCTCDDDGGL